eukprot:g78932.t1
MNDDNVAKVFLGCVRAETEPWKKLDGDWKRLVLGVSVSPTSRVCSRSPGLFPSLFIPMSTPMLRGDRKHNDWEQLASMEIERAQTAQELSMIASQLMDLLSHTENRAAAVSATPREQVGWGGVRERKSSYEPKKDHDDWFVMTPQTMALLEGDASPARHHAQHQQKQQQADSAKQPQRKTPPAAPTKARKTKKVVKKVVPAPKLAKQAPSKLLSPLQQHLQTSQQLSTSASVKQSSEPAVRAVAPPSTPPRASSPPSTPPKIYAKAARKEGKEAKITPTKTPKALEGKYSSTSTPPKSARMTPPNPSAYTPPKQHAKSRLVMHTDGYYLRPANKAKAREQMAVSNFNVVASARAAIRKRSVESPLRSSSSSSTPPRLQKSIITGIDQNSTPPSAGKSAKASLITLFRTGSMGGKQQPKKSKTAELLKDQPVSRLETAMAAVGRAGDSTLESPVKKNGVARSVRGKMEEPELERVIGWQHCMASDKNFRNLNLFYALSCTAGLNLVTLRILLEADLLTTHTESSEALISGRVPAVKRRRVGPVVPKSLKTRPGCNRFHREISPMLGKVMETEIPKIMDKAVVHSVSEGSSQEVVDKYLSSLANKLQTVVGPVFEDIVRKSLQTAINTAVEDAVKRQHQQEVTFISCLCFRLRPKEGVY